MTWQLHKLLQFIELVQAIIFKNYFQKLNTKIVDNTNVKMLICVQWKPINGITVGQRQTDSNNGLIIISG